MAFKKLLGDQKWICQTLLAIHKEQNKTLMLQIELEDRKQKAKIRRKANGLSPQDMLSKRLVTTAGPSSKLAAPLLPNKTMTIVAQDVELANATSLTAVPAMPPTPQETLVAHPQGQHQMALTLIMTTAIKMHAAALCTARSTLTTKHAAPRNASHNKLPAPFNPSNALPFITAPLPQADT